MISKFYILTIFVFLLGLFFRLFTIEKQDTSEKKLFYAFLFLTPVFYWLLTGFLIGITPSLWMPAENPELYKVITPFLTNLITNKEIFQYGAFAIRQNLFLYIGLFLDVFLVGFFMMGILIKKFGYNSDTKKEYPLKIILFFVMTTIFLFHPQGINGIKIFTAFFKNNVDLTQYSAQKKADSDSEKSIIVYLLPSSTITIQRLSNAIFLQPAALTHQSGVTNILVDDYVKANRNNGIPPAIFNLVFDHMNPSYMMVKTPPWSDVLYRLYKTFPQKN